MIFRPLKLILLALLLVFIYLPGFPINLKLIPHPAAAVSFTLYGRISPLSTAGWGSTASSTKSPGPTLSVLPGASVTLSLFSADGFGHTFCVDYESVPNFICDANEPLSPLFSSPTIPIMFTFTATSTPGNYTYYCTIHGSPMIGTFQVTPHDVAVTGISTSRNLAYNSVSANPVQVNVTAANLGTTSDTFFVSAKGNSTLIGNQSITLDAGRTTVVSFNWTTSSLVRGNYILSAQATKLAGELNTANNSFNGSNLTVKFKGDVSGDCMVDITDLSLVGGAFGKVLGQTGYNPAADLNNDGTINIIDLVVVAGNFGQHC